MRKILKFITNLWRRLVWFFRAKRNRKYRVVRCPDMPSMVGMKTIGQPEEGRPSVFSANVGLGYRTITPVRVVKLANNNMEIYTKYIYIFVKRIK